MCVLRPVPLFPQSDPCIMEEKRQRKRGECRNEKLRAAPRKQLRLVPKKLLSFLFILSQSLCQQSPDARMHTPYPLKPQPVKFKVSSVHPRKRICMHNSRSVRGDQPIPNTKQRRTQVVHQGMKQILTRNAAVFHKTFSRRMSSPFPAPLLSPMMTMSSDSAQAHMGWRSHMWQAQQA